MTLPYGGTVTVNSNFRGLTSRVFGDMMFPTIESLLRGRDFVWKSLLNKITGCKSRTVPPLYVPMVGPKTKVSHWETGKTGPPLV